MAEDTQHGALIDALGGYIETGPDRTVRYQCIYRHSVDKKKGGIPAFYSSLILLLNITY